MKRRGSQRDSLSEFERAVGPRDLLASKISANKLTPSQETLVGMLLDPFRMDDSLATLAADADVTPEEILNLFRKGAVAEAHAIATSQIAAGLPRVTKAILEGAVERERTCLCVRNSVADPKCSKCRGTGRWLQPADVDRQQMVWEAAGLLKKGGGVTVNQSTSVGVALQGSFMDRFVRATDSIAYDINPKDVIDVKETPHEDT